MSSAVGVGLPLLITMAMIVVGLELTVDDLKRVAHYPLHVLSALLVQLVVLPLLAAGLIHALHPGPAVVAGLVLTAAAPQAISSNVFCLLARADIALSVTLTAVSSALAVVTMPLVAGALFDGLHAGAAGFALPTVRVMQQIATGLLLPVTIGMSLRHFVPEFVAHWRGAIQSVNLAGLGMMLAIMAFDQAHTIRDHGAGIALAAALFVVGAAAAGLAMARAFSWDRRDTVTMLAAFPSRSLSIATLIAVNVLGRREFLSFAVVFFVVQAVVLAPVMILARDRRDG
jgi:BASS family bile acid:Na+ symporter